MKPSRNDLTLFPVGCVHFPRNSIDLRGYHIIKRTIAMIVQHEISNPSIFAQQSNLAALLFFGFEVEVEVEVAVVVGTLDAVVLWQIIESAASKLAG
jgi:hypothetical protein